MSLCVKSEAVYLIPVFFSLSFKPFKVLATETLSEKALEADVYNAIATEKVDGTCCYVTNYKGKIQLPCLLNVLSFSLYKFCQRQTPELHRVSHSLVARHRLVEMGFFKT